MAYSASHAQKDAILSLAKEGVGREGGKGRFQDAVSTCPPTGDAVEMGEGYTEQLRLQTVLKTGSAHQFQRLQNTCKDKSEFQT